MLTANYFLSVRLLRYIAIALLTAMALLFLAQITIFWQSANDTSPIQIAIAAPLSGKEGSAPGEELVRCVQMYIDDINAEGGINGRSLEATVFDDRQDKKIAPEVAAKIVKTPAVLVLGHRSSSVSAAAGEIYRQYSLPAISGTSNSDSVTIDNPYYFRATYTRTMMFKVLSLYSQKILNTNTVSVISYDGYGKKLGTDFATELTLNSNLVKHRWEIDVNAAEQSIESIVDELAADPNPGLVYFSMRAEEIGEALLVEMRRRGLNPPILLAQPLSREEFARRFDRYPEEQQNPGFFTNGIYATSPLLFDSGSIDAQEFGLRYKALYGNLPSYVGTKFYEAAILGVEAISRANLSSTDDIKVQRDRVRSELAKITNRPLAPRGLTGLLFFDATRSNPNQPVRIAQFYRNTLISAPEQFGTVDNPEREDLQRELQAGNILAVGDDYFWRQHVVYTGMDITRLSQLEQKSSRFAADFYLWFRYAEDADLSNVTFPGAKSSVTGQPIFSFDRPIESGTSEDGLNYRLYRVRGLFKTGFDLRDYPFDRQQLEIALQNGKTPSNRLMYVIDTFGLRLPQADATSQNIDFKIPELWKFKGLQYARETFRTTSTEGNPQLFNTDNRVDYSGLKVSVTLQRRPLIFLIKNLLPVILLSLVPLTTLYFPRRLSKERPPVAVSALISGTVLLVGVYRQLPEIGYTVAIECLFYIFFGLSLSAIVVGIIGDRLTIEGKTKQALRLDYAARSFYLLVVLGTVISYWLIFSSRIGR